jgi:hypothetical protein
VGTIGTRTKLSYWDQPPPRWFVSSRIEAGGYVKPQAAIGYGEPHWAWAGAEAWLMSTFSFAAAYFGIRGSLPFVDLRLGLRNTYSYHRSFLEPMEHYPNEAISELHGPHARYLSLETELSGVIPLLDGYLFPVVTFYAMPDVPEGKYLFDESLRGIMKPPFIEGNRLGYVKNFGKNDFIKLGVLSELIVLPGRGDVIFRLGPAGAVSITDHLDLQGTITFVLSSPDDLSVWNGSFGVLGFAYRMATGDPSPHFP